MKLRGILLTLLLVPLLALAGVLLAPFTATGTRLLVESLDGLGGLEFSYGGGSLMGELVLARVYVPTDVVIVEVRGGRARLDRGCLLRARLCLLQLSAASVDVEVLLDEEDLEEEDEEYLFWPLPFEISSGNVLISQTRVYWEDTDIRTGKISGAARLVGDLISVSDAQAQGLSFVMLDTDEEASAGPLDLPDVDLPATIELENVSLHDAGWDIYGLRNHYDLLRLSGRWEGLELKVSGARVQNNEWGSLALAGQMTFIHPYRLALDADFKLAQPPLWRGLNAADGELRIAGDLGRLQLDGNLCAALALDLQASLDLVTPGWPLSLEAREGCAETGEIVLAELPGLEELSGLVLAPGWSIEIGGDREEQQLALSAQVDQADYGTVELRAEGSNRDGVLYLEELRASLPEAESAVRLEGELSYLDQLAWDLELELEQFVLPRQLLPLAGRLSGPLRSRGRLAGDEWVVALSQVALQGEVNELPANITGQLNLDQDFDLDGSDLQVDLNGAFLSLVDREGVLPRADIEFSDFGRWLEGAGGSARASLSWDRGGSLVKLQGDVESLRAGPLWLNEARLIGRHDYKAGGEFSLQLLGDRLKLGDSWIERIDMLVAGTPLTHRLTFSSGGDLDTKLVLDGSLAEGDWTGSLQPLVLRTTAGSWTLDQAVAVDYVESAGQLSLADHCWVNPGQLDICIVELMLGEDGVARANLDGDLGAIPDLFPEQFRISAPLHAELDAIWQDLEVATLDAVIELQAGRVREHLLGGEFAEYVWDGASLQYRGSHEDGRLWGAMRQGGQDKVSLDLTIPAAMDAPLSGELVLRGLELAAFNAFLEQFSHLSGQVSGDLAFRGRLLEPEIRGELLLSDGAVALSSTPNQLENINLRANFTGRQARLAGQVSVGGGDSRLQGELDWLQRPSLRLSMSGGPKELLFPTDTEVTVSEDLLLTIDSDSIRLTGRVDVPSGSVLLEQLPQGAVEVSDDVVLYDHTGERLEQGSQLPVEIEIQVAIADKFNVVASGIEGRLGGDLLVRQMRGRPLQLLGNLRISQGKMELLGPRFNVKRGQLSFVGVPDNPNLDIVLERLVSEDQVTVGIRVGGSLDQPRLDFYSRPSLPEKEVMAYVMGGRGIDRTGDADSMALALAMTSGLMQSRGMLKGVSLGVEGRDRKARAAIGGYISDRIYLSYGVGLYTPINTLTVRMDVIRNLWVEMVSGLESSADLYYSWSR